MKKNGFRIILPLFLAVLAAFGLLYVTSRADEAEEIRKVYQYPMRPGSEAWSKLEGHQEMIDACQLPEDWLMADTPDLLATVLEYPLLADLFAWGTFARGVEQVSSYFNGLEELLKRSDLVESARQMKFSDLIFEKDYEKEVAGYVLEYLKQEPGTW